MPLVVKAATQMHWFGELYSAGDPIDTTGYDDHAMAQLLTTQPVYVSEGGGSSLVGYDQIELDFGGDLSGDAGSTTEWIVPLTMTRQGVQDWGGVMEASSVEVTVPANATMKMRWITDRDTKSLAFAGVKIRKVRDDAGAYSGEARWSASMNTPGDAGEDGTVTFDTFDTATSDLDQGTSPAFVKFLTAGTYRVYSELDVAL